MCIARCMVLAATLLLASSLESRADEAAKRSSWFGFGAKPTSDASSRPPRIARRLRPFSPR